MGRKKRENFEGTSRRAAWYTKCFHGKASSSFCTVSKFFHTSPKATNNYFALKESENLNFQNLSQLRDTASPFYMKSSITCTNKKACKLYFG
jgi:hypothetical protein